MNKRTTVARPVWLETKVSTATAAMNEVWTETQLHKHLKLCTCNSDTSSAYPLLSHECVAFIVAIIKTPQPQSRSNIHKTN